MSIVPNYYQPQVALGNYGQSYFGQPVYGQQPSYGQSIYGQQPTYGQPSYGLPQAPSPYGQFPQGMPPFGGPRRGGHHHKHHHGHHNKGGQFGQNCANPYQMQGFSAPTIDPMSMYGNFAATSQPYALPSYGNTTTYDPTGYLALLGGQTTGLQSYDPNAALTSYLGSLGQGTTTTQGFDPNMLASLLGAASQQFLLPNTTNSNMYYMG